MNGAGQSLISQLARVIHRPAFWIILASFVLITLPHYHEAFEYPVFLTYIMPTVDLSRHALERILFLVPVVWAGFLFGLRGTVITSLVALACMLPRAVFISPSPLAAMLEAGAAFLVGGCVSALVAFSLRLVRREREYLGELEATHKELAIHEGNLRFYLLQATKAQEEERKRISRELHDETIQDMVILSRQLDALASSSKNLSEDDRHSLEELLQQTSNLIRGVRRLSQDLRPAALDRLGLLAALEWLASDVAEYSGITTEVKVLGSGRRFPEEVELVLFRITQEAMRNVWRHSQASKAEIAVEFEQSRIKITVKDNGSGFNVPQRIGDLAKDGKLGLAGMQERAQLIGGELTVQSHVDKGTSVTIELP